MPTAVERALARVKLASQDRDWWIPAGLLLLPFVFNWDFILGRVRHWFFDVRFQWLPWQRFVIDSVLRGDEPFWNPYLMLGFSQVGESQVGMFYPPNWVTAFIDLEWRFALILCLHMSMAKLGTYALLRHVGLGRAASVFGAVSFGLCGFMVGQARNYVLVQGAAYLPLFVLWLTQYLDTHKLRYLGYVSIGIALSLCIAHAGTTFMILGGISFYYFFRLLGSPRFVKDGGLYLAAVALGVLFAAVQVLPILELKPLSERANALEFHYSLNPKYNAGFLRKLSFFFPWMFGTTRGAPAAFGYEESHYYAGAFVPIVAAAGALTWRRVQGAQGRFLAAMCGAGAVAFALSLGDYFPLFNPWALLHKLPGFSMFRVPARWGCIFTFALSVLAAFGLQALRDRSLRTRVLFAGAILLPLVGALAAVLQAGLDPVLDAFANPKAIMADTTNAFEAWIVQPLSRINPLFVYGGLVTPFLLLYWLSRKNRLGLAPFGVAVTALLIVDLFLMESPTNPRTKDLSYFDWDPKEELLRGKDPYCRIHPPKREQGDSREYLRHNVPSYFRVFSTFGSTPLEIKKYMKLRNAFDEPHVLDYVGTCYEFKNGRYRKRPGAFPRAFVASEVKNTRSRDPIKRFEKLDREQLRNIVYLSPGEYADAKETLRSSRKTAPRQKVTIREFDNDLAVFDVTTSAAGMLVFTDMHYPGWRATVDGKKAHVYAAQGVFRGVIVSKGKHRVRFEYHPTSVYYGAVLSLLSLGAFFASLVVFRKRLFGAARPMIEAR